jgi:serine phosphatase RsbU (regulator of sigma subunit)
MKHRQLLIVLCVSMLSYAALALLLPGMDALARSHYTLDRPIAISRAQEVAQQWAPETVEWPVWPSARWGSRDLITAAVGPDRTLPRFFARVITSVEFNEPDSESSFRVSLDEEGRPMGIRWERPADAGSETAGSPDTRILAEQALERLTGETVSAYELASTESTDKGGLRFTWWREHDTMDHADLEVLVEVRGGLLQRVQARPRWNQAFSDRVQRQALVPLIVRGVPRGLGMILIWIGAIVLTIDAVNRRSVSLRQVLFMTVVMGAILAPLINWRDSPGTVASQVLIFLVFFAPYPAVLWAGGFITARRSVPERLLAAGLLARGHLFARPVGRSLATGMLLGGAVALVPCILVATGWFAGAGMRTVSTNVLVQRPLHLLFLEDAPFDMLLVVASIYAFLAPILEDRLRSRRLAMCTTVLLGTLLLLAAHKVNTSTMSIFVVALALAVLYDVAWRHFGLLATVTAAVTGVYASHAVVLLSLQSASLQRSGWTIISLGALIFVGALMVAIRGRDIGLQALPPALGQPRTERDRIRAELQVAQAAQIKMLPDVPPEIPGLSIAAVCQPAREVGGDLFDFSDHDGKLGIAVGDVSGKGMSAALYMTLTLGLLGAASEDRDDPAEILSDVNQDLFARSPRNVFVTMFFGILDPATRTLRFARAGHNPLILRRHRQGDTVSLCPAGLALGLTAGRTFNPTLETVEIQLEVGDTIFVCSDGITEAMNRKREEYDEERLLAAIERADGLSAEGTRDAILKDLAAFVGKAPVHDDVTLVVVQIKE